MVDKKSTFAERLIDLRKNSSLSLAALGKQLGVSAQAVHKWENGGHIEDHRAWELARLFNVPPAWLLWDAPLDAKNPHFPDRLKDGEESADKPTLPEISETGLHVPLLAPAGISYWVTNESDWRSYHAGEWIACPAEHGSLTFALRVQGISMENFSQRISYSEGDIIFIDPDRIPLSGDRALFSDTLEMGKERNVLLRELILEGGERFMRALNPAWPERIKKLYEHDPIYGTVIGKWAPE